ncbi:MAG: DUF1059 domain-containing protein [Anaerolineae bacterium]
MVKSFHCRYCDYVSTGETEEQIVQDMARHNKQMHNMEMDQATRDIIHADIREDAEAGARSGSESMH